MKFLGPLSKIYSSSDAKLHGDKFGVIHGEQEGNRKEGLVVGV